VTHLVSGLAPEGGLPPGTVRYATGVALATAALAGWRSGQPISVAETAVAVQLYLPEVMAAGYGAPAGMPIPHPIPAPGGGWLHADLGSPGDRERFDTLLTTISPDAPATVVAAAAQEWRLPVCDYRPRSGAERRMPISMAGVRAVPGSAPTGGRPLEGVQVCDLTAMWAGPLATWLVAGLGATVHKIEPDVRLDGFRAVAGGGIYPGGRQVDPGRDSAMWNALNPGKVRLPLDLRRARDRDEFVALARRSDVVVDSFSPRVMPNFGLSPLPEGPVGLSMPAFPPGPERDWVAYGSGVHAVLGLGERADGSFSPPVVSYPDPVAGLTGALAIVAAVVARDLGRVPDRMEVSLAAASQPLLSWTGRLATGRPSPAASLLAAGAFQERVVAGTRLPHPLSPFLDAGGSPLDKNLF
jgi:hypothetical protein